MSTRLPIVGPSLGGAPTPPPRPILPTVEALENLWEQVCHKPLWAPPHVLRYLKLRWRMRMRMLDPAQMTITAPRWKINDCASCTDICCVGPRSTVLLRLRDIATLIDLNRTDLIARNKPRFRQSALKKHVALRRQVSSQSWEIFPVLAQDPMGACAALTPAGKCELYPHWPLSCARFPYALDAVDERIFYSRRCDAFWIRPDAEQPVREMTAAAVAAYNERIKDLILLEYAPEALEALGLLRWLELKASAPGP